MKNGNQWIHQQLVRYLVYSLPLVITAITWGSFQSDQEIRSTGSLITKWAWEVLSWGTIVWFICLFVFMVLLVFRKETQESTIKYLAGIKERDEREQAIVGMAARRSFVATTGLLVSLLFLSCFTLNVARLTDQTIDGKKSSLSLGFHFSASDLRAVPSEDGTVIYEHRDLPLSKSGIILLILVWQLSTFRIRARREFSGPVFAHSLSNAKNGDSL
jgi:hypothetical protein